MPDVETIEWTPESIKQIGAALEGSSPEAILRWGFENFAPSIVLATGFGPEGIVLMHLVSQIRPRRLSFIWIQICSSPIPMNCAMNLSGVLIFALNVFIQGFLCQSRPFGMETNYGTRDPDTCCHIRKVIPQRQFLANYSAWITGIRRDQTAFRANTALVEWDYANKMVKLNPLAAWTSDQVWEHIHANRSALQPSARLWLSQHRLLDVHQGSCAR